eukprot:525294_1
MTQKQLDIKQRCERIDENTVKMHKQIAKIFRLKQPLMFDQKQQNTLIVSYLFRITVNQQSMQIIPCDILNMLILFVESTDLDVRDPRMEFWKEHKDSKINYWQLKFEKEEQWFKLSTFGDDVNNILQSLFLNKDGTYEFYKKCDDRYTCGCCDQILCFEYHSGIWSINNYDKYNITLILNGYGYEYDHPSDIKCLLEVARKPVNKMLSLYDIQN